MITLKVGEVVKIQGDHTEYVVNRISPTLKEGIPVRAQIDMMSKEELKRRHEDLTGLIALSERR
jgi:hypothetical protein